jgi:thiol-disulfide isomerase/thioredoxin
MIINEQQSDYYANLCVYYWGKQMPTELFEKVKKHKAYLISNDGVFFYDYFQTYLKYFASKNEVYDIFANTKRESKILDSLFAPSKSDFLKTKISSRDLGERKKILELVLPAVKTDWCKTVIQNEYNKTTEKLAAIKKTLEEATPIISANPLGQPVAALPFDAKLYKADSLTAKELLSNLKSSFNGKALFIDIWATWCMPCLAEMPASQRLHEAAKDLPVEFVYLCTSGNSDIKKWQTKIGEFKLSGTHIFVAENIMDKLREMLSSVGFPTYIIITTKGTYKTILERPSVLNENRLAELIQ